MRGTEQSEKTWKDFQILTMSSEMKEQRKWNALLEDIAHAARDIALAHEYLGYRKRQAAVADI